MKTIELGEHTYIISDDIYNERYEKMSFRENKRLAHMIISYFTKAPKFKELIRPVARSTNLKGFKILHAHGSTHEGKWVFREGELDYPVQEWVNRFDGSALALIIACCNPDNLEVRANHSLIVQPKEIFCLVDVLLDPSIISVRTPLLLS